MLNQQSSFLCCAQHNKLFFMNMKEHGTTHSRYCLDLYKEEMLYNMFELIYKLVSRSFN